MAGVDWTNFIESDSDDEPSSNLENESNQSLLLNDPAMKNFMAQKNVQRPSIKFAKKIPGILYVGGMDSQIEMNPALRKLFGKILKIKCKEKCALITFPDSKEAGEMLLDPHFRKRMKTVLGTNSFLIWHTDDLKRGCRSLFAHRWGIQVTFNLAGSNRIEFVYKYFAKYGDILSIRPIDPDKGSWEIDFAWAKSAIKAINECPDRRTWIDRRGSGKQWDQVYVHGVPSDWTRMKFIQWIEKESHGSVAECTSMDEQRYFVRFVRHAQAIDFVKSHPINSKTIESGAIRAVRWKRDFEAKMIRERRQEAICQAKRANLYWRPLSESLQAMNDDSKWYEKFKKFGPIISLKVVSDESGSKCIFGFVQFASVTSALVAKKSMCDGKEMLVFQAQTKRERQIFLKRAKKRSK